MEYPTDFINKVICGDCIEVMKLIDSESVDLILTDPPYLKAYSTGYRKNIKRKTTEILNDRVFDYDTVFSECSRILKPNSHIYVFGCWQTSSYFYTVLTKYFKIKNRLIWVKNNWTAGDLLTTYGQSYEEIWFCTNGHKKLNSNRDRDCLFYSRVVGKGQFHLNQKPVALIEFLIKKSSEEGDLIFDFFAGVGTTGVACINLNRNFILIEQEQKYCKIGEARIESAKTLFY